MTHANPYLLPGQRVVTMSGGDFEADCHEVFGTIVENDGRLPIVQWDDCTAPMAAPFQTFEVAPAVGLS